MWYELRNDFVNSWYTKQKSTIMKTKECENCDGTGTIEVRAICTVYPYSECCGGCTDDVDCPECDGSGEIEDEDEEE